MKAEVFRPEPIRASVSVLDAILHRVRTARQRPFLPRTRGAITKRNETVQERLSELGQFFHRYEELVEALCDAAQYGPTPKLERAYREEREWMKTKYPALRPRLSAFLQRESDEADFRRARAGERPDAFEALVAAETLDELLRYDDGSMISRITRTREALILYGEHLRQLAARIA